MRGDFTSSVASIDAGAGQLHLAASHGANGRHRPAWPIVAAWFPIQFGDEVVELLELAAR